MLQAAIVDLLGEVPAGFEPLLYVISAVVLLWMLQFVSSVLWTVLSWFGGR